LLEKFEEVPEIRMVLWGGESGMEGYYFSEIVGRRRRRWRQEDNVGQVWINNTKQLIHFEL
jgi:hypothetical protein